MRVRGKLDRVRTARKQYELTQRKNAERRRRGLQAIDYKIQKSGNDFIITHVNGNRYKIHASKLISRPSKKGWVGAYMTKLRKRR